ncbi:hypothetical protein [Limnothrix sp. PR1529]|nr:hypothetical protein [Limnothrix sp. PR1529]
MIQPLKIDFLKIIFLSVLSWEYVPENAECLEASAIFCGDLSTGRSA